MSLTSTIKNWFKEKQKPATQKCIGYPDNNSKIRTNWIDNFNAYVQRNHGYKRMHTYDYYTFYSKAKEDVQKAVVRKPHYESPLKLDYSWEYAR